MTTALEHPWTTPPVPGTTLSGEVLAHLHLLESDGAVTRLSDEAVDRFRRA